MLESICSVLEKIASVSITNPADDRINSPAQTGQFPKPFKSTNPLSEKSKQFKKPSKNKPKIPMPIKPPVTPPIPGLKRSPGLDIVQKMENTVLDKQFKLDKKDTSNQNEKVETEESIEEGQEKKIDTSKLHENLINTLKNEKKINNDQQKLRKKLKEIRKNKNKFLKASNLLRDIARTIQQDFL